MCARVCAIWLIHSTWIMNCKRMQSNKVSVVWLLVALFPAYACMHVYVNRNEWTLHHLADGGKTFFLWQSCCGRSVGDMCVESVHILYVGCHSVHTLDGVSGWPMAYFVPIRKVQFLNFIEQVSGGRHDTLKSRKWQSSHCLSITLSCSNSEFSLPFFFSSFSHLRREAVVVRGCCLMLLKS